MSGFVKRNKVVDTANPAGGIDPAKSPNVGQYGWTSYDAGNVNQIIEYVDLCKKYAESASQSAEYIEGQITELDAFIRYIEKVYEELKPVYENILPIYHDIIVRHEDIKTRHLDIVGKYVEIQDWHHETGRFAEESEANANKALASQLLAGQSEQGAEGWYDKSYELYDELRKGNVYRGTWNPHTGAYPDAGGTNSTWDVILNEGELEYRWNNILWFWGDRLVYIKDSGIYQQIESGTTVTSVNGKKGAVTLNADDVGAVPVTRTVNEKALSANITITAEDTNSVPTTRRINNKVLDSDVVLTHEDVHAVPLDGSKAMTSGLTVPYINLSNQDTSINNNEDENIIQSTKTYGAILVGNESKNTYLVYRDNLFARKGVVDHLVYHEGFKPTAADVGAAPSGYGLGEAFSGELVGSKDLDTFKYNGFRTYNQDSGDMHGPTHYGTCMDFGHIGNGTSFIGWAGQMFLGNNGTLYTRVNKNPGSFEESHWNTVYTYQNKPTAADVGALPLTGGVMDGPIQLQSGKKSAIDVPDQASIRFRDGSGAWMHQTAKGGAIEWGHGSSGENIMASLDSNGTFSTRYSQYGTHQIAKSENNTTWLGMESSPTADPYISYKAQGMENVAVGMVFKANETVSTKTFASEHFRVASDGGLKFCQNSGYSGPSWGTGVDPAGDLNTHHYVDGAWQRAQLQLDTNGTSRFSGPLVAAGTLSIGEGVTTGGGLDVRGGYIKSEKDVNPAIEWHAPGKHAWISYVPDTGGLIMGPSNGGGGISSQAVHLTKDSNNFTGRITVAQNQSRGWEETGRAAFHHNQTEVGAGNLQGLVTGHYLHPGVYSVGMGLGSVHGADRDSTGHVLWAAEGRDYLKIWKFQNNGTLSAPADGWAIDGTGMLNGTVWGGDLNKWIATYYAPISDATMKRNIKPSTKSALGDVSKIDFVSYDWDETSPLTKDKKSPKIGLTAQQMEEIDPCYSRDIETFKEDGVTVETSVKSLDVTNMLALALKAVQELQEYNQSQQDQINELKEKLNEFILK